MNPTVKKLIKRIALEENLPFRVVEKIVNSQFKFVRKVMGEGVRNVPETFKTVQLTHLGKFALRKKKLQDYKNKADERR